MRGVRRHGYRPGDRFLFKGGSPHSRPQASRAKSSPTCSRVLPLRHGAGAHASLQADPERKKPKPPHAERVTAPRLQALLHLRRNKRSKGRTTMQVACNRTAEAHPSGFAGYYRPARRPRPTRHVTDAPVTKCEKLHRHLHQYHASSTVGPVSRLEATLHMSQQCRSSTSITG
jgi:hypothetical protein